MCVTLLVTEVYIHDVDIVFEDLYFTDLGSHSRQRFNRKYSQDGSLPTKYYLRDNC